MNCRTILTALLCTFLARDSISVWAAGGCEIPSLPRGNFRLRQRGKLVRFQCQKGYTLIGSAYAGCVHGKWDAPMPFCAKSGCEKHTRPANGLIIPDIKGTRVELFCMEGYQVAGNRVAYCDGDNWDRTLGTCRETNRDVLLGCDFETEDICGWTHDGTHDFDWKRALGIDYAHRHFTGPKHDHTTMQANGGYYMLMESLNQEPNKSARLISSIYASKFCKDACLRFWYHMYGYSVGSLRAYIKPTNVDIETILEDPKYKVFEISGNQKNLWQEAIVDIDECDSSFQIIIEGITGERHLSDIAIDDIALMQDAACTGEKQQTKPPVTEETGGIFDILSCNDRCNETTPTKREDQEILSGTGAGGVIKSCDCHPECEDIGTCCPDYRSVCEFAATELTTVQEQEVRTTPFITTKFQKNEVTTVRMEATTRRVQKTTIPAILPTTKAPSTTDSTTTSSTITTKIYDVQQDGHKVNIKNFEHYQRIERSTSFLTVEVLIFLVLGILCAFALLIIVGIIYYKKAYDPGNYKKNAVTSNRTANSEEFSEIRYLTSDEQIDFTLQTPDS